MSQGINSVLGCKVNIISKLRIRYEGILTAVDAEKPDDPVITLSQVISHGTEDRACDKYFPPKPGCYENITFRGKDLEDISLVNPEPEETLNDDPSILASGPPTQLPGAIGTPKQQQASLNVLSPKKDIKSSPPKPSPASDFFDNNVRAQPQQHQQQYNRPQQQQYPGNRSGYQQQQQQNNYYNNRGAAAPTRFRGGNQRGGHNRAPRANNEQQQQPTTFDSEYDIEEANKVLAAELEKLAVKPEGEEQEASTSQQPAAGNVLSGFFDNLSCEIIDKANGVHAQPQNRRNERKLNADTFGVDERSLGGYYRGRGGYNRRPYGGGGGYRGGGRGKGPGGNSGYWRRPQNNYRQNSQEVAEG